MNKKNIPNFEKFFTQKRLMIPQRKTSNFYLLVLILPLLNIQCTPISSFKASDNSEVISSSNSLESNTSGSSQEEGNPSPSPTLPSIPSPLPSPQPSNGHTEDPYPHWPKPPVDTTPHPSPNNGSSNNADCPRYSESFKIEQLKILPEQAYVSSSVIEIKALDTQQELIEFKISVGNECECGRWMKMTSPLNYQLRALQQKNIFSIQFKNKKGQYSRCESLSVNHDSIAPDISLTFDPKNNFEEGHPISVKSQVSDQGSGIKETYCTLNGSNIPCHEGQNDFNFTNLKEGSYSLVVTATDKANSTTQKQIAWVIKSLYQKMSQDLEVKSNNKVDILIIDDNSKSMQYEQSNMAQRMSTFLSVLNGLDWRIAITTTDPDSPEWGDGRILQTSGPIKEYFISSSMDPQKAHDSLAQTIQRSEIGSKDEQGIYATYRAIERSFDLNDPNSKFFRPDAHFAAVVISDEDESFSEFKNRPENLLAYVNKVWPQKNFAFHSIVNKTNDLQCKNTQGNTYGAAYEKMSQLTGLGKIGGAIIGSVCEKDYGLQLTGIGNSVQEMKKVIELNCEPIGSKESAVVISLNGNNYTGSYLIEGSRINFKESLPLGKYHLDYQCKK